MRFAVSAAAGVALASGLAMACQLDATGNLPPPDASKLIAGSPPVRVCLDSTTVDPSDLLAGRERLVLAVTEFEPPEWNAAMLRVVVPGAREQLIGIFPGTAFGATDFAQHRRALLRPLRGEHTLGQPICVSVSLLSDDGTGSATVHLEMQTVGR